MSRLYLPDAPIAVCDRCKRKCYHADLRPDGDNPAILVCSEACSDDYDPWKLGGPPPEQISLRNPRPDLPLDVEGDV